MKYSIILATDQTSLDKVKNLIASGWLPDPKLKVQVLPEGLVYHLIKPENETEMVETMTDTNKYNTVVDVIEVKPDSEPDGKVKELIAKGYEVVGVLKGCVQLVKRGERETGSTCISTTMINKVHDYVRRP